MRSKDDYRIGVQRTADDSTVIRVTGEIDMKNSLSFKESLDAVIDEDVGQVVVDLSAARDVDTTGLSVLWESAKRCRLEDRELAIVCLGGRVRSILADTGMDQVVATHGTLDEALGHDGPAARSGL
jgi:anti-anti-sigma factor